MQADRQGGVLVVVSRGIRVCVMRMRYEGGTRMCSKGVLIGCSCERVCYQRASYQRMCYQKVCHET